MTNQGCLPAYWPSISVIIPTLNEAKNLPHVFARLPDGVHEIIVVDTILTERRMRGVTGPTEPGEFSSAALEEIA
jgi:hypothetical protein